LWRKGGRNYGFTPEIWGIWVSPVVSLSIIRSLHPTNAQPKEVFAI
jgi:hypothetical protein